MEFKVLLPIEFCRITLREGIATKKIIFFSYLIIICLIISGCVDLNEGKRPIDQSDTKWVCINPDIYFSVNDKYKEIPGNNTYGTIMLDGITTEIALDFDYGSGVSFRPISSFHKEDGELPGYVNLDDFLFKGHCKFSKDKLVVKIFNNEKGFLDDSIKRITFIKE